MALRRLRVQPRRGVVAEGGAVQPEHGRTEANRPGVDLEHALAQCLAETVKGAPQARPAVALAAVGPEQRGQRIAALRPVGDGEVDQQGQCLAQVEVDGATVALQTGWSKREQLEFCHPISRIVSQWLPHLTGKRSHCIGRERLDASGDPPADAPADRSSTLARSRERVLTRAMALMAICKTTSRGR